MVPQLVQLLQRILSGADTARRFLAFWGPLIDAGVIVGPLLAIASLITFAVLTGVAVGTLSTLILTLAALYVLLTEVFGVSIDLNLS